MGEVYEEKALFLELLRLLNPDSINVFNVWAALEVSTTYSGFAQSNLEDCAGIIIEFYPGISKFTEYPYSL